jgi:hypothetical protein
MLRLSASAAIVAAALAASVVGASAQSRVEAGVLECRGETTNFILGSITELGCLYRPTPNMGPIQRYRATIRRVGLDIGLTGEQALAWGVFAPTVQIGLGDLSGNYGGVAAGAAVGGGVGANLLIGGSNNSFALQPLSLQGSTGLAVNAGIAGLELRFAR